MSIRRKQSEPRPGEFPEYLLKELYRNYHDTGFHCMDFAILSRPLRHDLTVIREIESDKPEVHVLRVWERYDLGSLNAAVRLMEGRGWVTCQKEPGIFNVCLTPQGIDRARWLLRSRRVQMWDFMKGDVRAIIVAAITAIVVTVVTTLVMRALGGS